MRRASHSPFILSPIAQAVSRLVVFATLGMAAAGTAHAQSAPAPARGASAATPAEMAEVEGVLKLKTSPQLAEEVSDDPENRGPTFIYGDRVSGRPDIETVIDGNAEMRRGATSIRADRIEYYQPEDQVKSRGNVRINRAGNRFEGPELEIKLDRFEGFFTTPAYRFLSNGGNGQAERVDFLDENH
ncbi:MAG: LPS-assembly protein LptD, partial [Polaromonas sp.]|nr:LPS-assembly protein LptD [Polaromonas sp.]